MSIKYQIKEHAIEARNSLIEKTGGTVEFSIAQIDSDKVRLESELKRIVSEMKIKEATKINVERTHPHVSGMSEEDLTAAYIFREATGFLHLAKEKKNEIEKQLSDYEEERNEIIKQTGLQL